MLLHCISLWFTLEHDFVPISKYVTPKASFASKCVCSGWSLAVNFVVEVLLDALAFCCSDICNSLAPAESIKACTVTMVHYWPPTTHTHPRARSHTHKHTLSHRGRQWHTDKDTHSHIQDTRPFPNMYIPHTWMRSSALSSASCPLGQGLLLRESSRSVFLYTYMFQQRSADIMVSALLMDVWLQDLPSLAGTKSLISVFDFQFFISKG